MNKLRTKLLVDFVANGDVVGSAFAVLPQVFLYL